MKSLLRKKPAGTAKPKPDHTEGPCLNCGNHMGVHDLFCPKCGQKRIEEEDMSFKHMVGESFLDYFHFESKFFRTVGLLLFKPGKLTVEFMEGKRKTYVEPFKLFLVISVVYFLLLPLADKSNPHKDQHDVPQTTHKVSGKDKIQPFKYSLNGMRLSAAGQDSIRREIDSIGLKEYVDKNFAKYGALTRLLMRQTFKILVYSGQSFNTVLEHTASKMIFLLIPVFALLLKLVFVRSGRLYFEHLIFSLHMHAMFFLLLLVKLLIGFILPVKVIIIFLISFVCLFFALKRNYGTSSGKTLWKLFLIILLYCVVALPVFFILLALVAVFLV